MEKGMVAESIIKSLTEKILEEPEKNVGLLYSGGLDSSIIGHILSMHFNVTAYTVGIDGSHDIKAALENSKYINFKRIKTIRIDEKDVMDARDFLISIFPGLGFRELSIKIPFYLGLKNADEKTVYVGQGADELFGGYKKYIENPKLMKKDVIKMMIYSIPIEKKIAEILGKMLKYPYVSKNILEISHNIPLNYKIDGNTRKVILREVARSLDLPESIYNMEKKAMQYGSGVTRVLRKIE